MTLTNNSYWRLQHEVYVTEYYLVPIHTHNEHNAQIHRNRQLTARLTETETIHQNIFTYEYVTNQSNNENPKFFFSIDSYFSNDSLNCFWCVYMCSFVLALFFFKFVLNETYKSERSITEFSIRIPETDGLKIEFKAFDRCVVPFSIL